MIMNKTLSFVLLLGLSVLISGHNDSDHDHDHAKKVVQVEVGDHCDPAAAPDPQDGSWHTVDDDVEKVCSPGSSCRKGACNCDDLPDGTQTGISQDNNGTRVCRHLAGQKCSSDDQCFENVICSDGVCTCPQDVECQTTKNDVYILD